MTGVTNIKDSLTRRTQELERQVSIFCSYVAHTEKQNSNVSEQLELLQELCRGLNEHSKLINDVFSAHNTVIKVHNTCIIGLSTTVFVLSCLLVINIFI